MIYLSKILPVFFLPIGLTVIAIGIGLILRRPAVSWAGAIALLLMATPFVGGAAMRVAEGWQLRQSAAEAPTAHAIVVLSHGRVQPPGAPTVSEWIDADRFYGGVELYKAGKAPLLIFTGGWVPWQPDAEPEGDVLIRYASDLGVPRERMIATARVSNTDAEGRAVAELLSKHVKRADDRPQILLVTSAFHMRRARMLFTRAGLDVLPFPVDFKAGGNGVTLLSFIPNAASLSHTELALRELYGMAFYSFF